MKTMNKFKTWLILFVGFFILSTLMERGLIWEMYETIDGESISSYTTEAGEDNNLKVLKEINKKGIPVCIVTGRSYNRCKHIYEQLELSTPLCVFNGSYVFSLTHYLKKVHLSGGLFLIF